MLQSTTIRIGTASDVATIQALVNAAYAKWVRVIGREPRPMLADYGAAVKRHRFDLAEVGGAIVGLIETELRSDHLWIENVAVHPDHQRCGHGKRLLEHAEAMARSANLAELRLLTNAAFAVNIALYERLGYRITHTEPFGNGTTVHMSKPLSP